MLWLNVLLLRLRRGRIGRESIRNGNPNQTKQRHIPALSIKCFYWISITKGRWRIGINALCRIYIGFWLWILAWPYRSLQARNGIFKLITSGMGSQRRENIRRVSWQMGTPCHILLPRDKLSLTINNRRELSLTFPQKILHYQLNAEIPTPSVRLLNERTDWK